MRKIKGKSEIYLVFLIGLMFSLYLYASAYYLDDATQIKMADYQFNQDNEFVILPNGSRMQNPNYIPVHERFINDPLGTTVGGMADLVLWIPNTVMENFVGTDHNTGMSGLDIFDLMKNIIFLDIKPLNDLAELGFAIKLVIWAIYGLMLIKVIPFFG